MSKRLNMMDFAATIDLLNVLIKLKLNPDENGIADLEAQLDMMKYRSNEWEPDHTSS